MNRRTFLQGVALLGSALGLRLPKPEKRDTWLSRRLAWLESHYQKPYIAQPGDSMYIGNGDPWGGGAIGFGGDDWGDDIAAGEEAYGPYFTKEHTRQSTLAVGDYTKQIDFSRRVFIDDDLAGVARKWGESAARFEDKWGAALLES